MPSAAAIYEIFHYPRKDRPVVTSNLKKVAAWGEQWQASGQWQAHTVGPAEATNLAEGYLALVAALCDWKPGTDRPAGLDIGAGAGYLAAALDQRGIRMVATEWNETGIELIRHHNPALEVRKLDVLAFDDHAAWDFVFCRELYPFTRVNAFTDQHAIISALIDGLRPGGVLVLVGSEVLWPHCADYRLLIRTFRTDPRLAFVGPKYPEALLRRFQLQALGAFGYRLLATLFWPLMAFKRRFRGWAMIDAIVFRKKRAA